MTPELLARLSGRTDASELLAVVRMRDESFAQIPLRNDLLAVVVDRPGNPGNLGTLIRSCDALGAHGLIVTGHAVDPYDPATITATRGSLFALPVVQAPSHAEVLQWVGSARAHLGGCQLVGTDEHADIALAAHDFTTPTVLVIGNESHGLSRAYRDACDAVVRIPMCGSASSLNVSVAASIAIYEAVRQRASA
jgi:TrmH family RNA methyltransferase